MYSCSLPGQPAGPDVIVSRLSFVIVTYTFNYKTVLTFLENMIFFLFWLIVSHVLLAIYNILNIYLYITHQRREIKENGNGEYAERHVHAWASERSSSLSALTLRRATQLLAHLGTPVVLYRESATKESPRMLSYFCDGIRLADIV